MHSKSLLYQSLSILKMSLMYLVVASKATSHTRYDATSGFSLRRCLSPTLRVGHVPNPVLKLRKLLNKEIP